MWDERDNLTNQNLPKVRPSGTGHNLIGPGSSEDVPRVTGTAPVVRADGTLFLPPGTLFMEKYQIAEIVGEGAMSVCHKARHSVMKNTVVLKLIKGIYASNSRAVLRFQREGQIVQRLNHVNIVRTFEVGLPREGQPYVAAEWLEGKSLAALLQEHGAPPLPMARTLFAQMVDGLDAAHAQGFSHRGLKPSNIFVTNLGSPNPVVKLLDFGLADTFDDEEDGSKRVTSGGKYFSAPKYMSPEQCLGKPVDDRTDIYSLGCVMYETLTGQPPFSGASPDEVLQRQCQQAPRIFREVVPQRYELAEIEPIVMKCLAKDPGARYQTMAQVGRALLEPDEANRAATATSAMVDKSAALAAEEAERQKVLLLQRIIIGVCVFILMIPVVGVLLFKASEVDVALPGAAEHAAFAMDRGQYDDAKKQYGDLLAEARKSDRKADMMRLLGVQATLEHVLGNRDAEGKADEEINGINEASGSQIYVDKAAAESIDAMLASDKSNEDMEKELKPAVQKLVDQTQGLAWSQQYAPAQEAMALLIDKVSRKLGPTSPLVVDLKLQYASRLLQKIVNPAAPLTASEQKDMVGEPMASLDTPMAQSQGTDLLLAKASFALGQAISGKTDEASTLKNEVTGAYKNEKSGPDNTSLIEVRLADTNRMLGDYGAAVELYKAAYQKFLAEKKYPQAAYCVSAASRSAWLAAQIKPVFDFLSGEAGKADLSGAEAAILKAEVDAWLAQMDLWIATTDEGTRKHFMFRRDEIKKSDTDLRRDAERLALESVVTSQSIRPSELWMTNPSLDTLIKCYYDGNTVGRSVPLIRLKLALAERRKETRIVHDARSNLATALIAYGKAGLSGFYTTYDHTQIVTSKISPGDEAKLLYEASYTDLTNLGEAGIFWISPWYAQLAANYIENDAVKAVLQTACRKSCEHTGDSFGKDSSEYLDQLRWHGHLGAMLGKPSDSKSPITQEAKAALDEACEVAKANPKIPLLNRLGAFDELIHFSQSANDQAGAKKTASEMDGLKANK